MKLNKKAVQQCIKNRIEYVLNQRRMIADDATPAQRIAARKLSGKLINRSLVVRKANAISMEFGLTVVNFDVKDSEIRFDLEEV